MWTLNWAHRYHQADCKTFHHKVNPQNRNPISVQTSPWAKLRLPQIHIHVCSPSLSGREQDYKLFYWWIYIILPTSLEWLQLSLWRISSNLSRSNRSSALLRRLPAPVFMFTLLKSFKLLLLLLLLFWLLLFTILITFRTVLIEITAKARKLKDLILISKYTKYIPNAYDYKMVQTRLALPDVLDYIS